MTGFESHLATVVAAWPNLLEAIRAGIVATVKAASGRDRWWIMRPQAGSPKGPLPNDLRQPTPIVAHHLPTDTCKTDTDLAAVVAAWPDLPEAIKAGIVAMVRCALKL